MINIQADDFNPRSPCGERHELVGYTFSSWDISIHAPRVGSDCHRLQCTLAHRHFNPRSPCGERPPSLGHSPKLCIISIHAPRVGSDFRPMFNRRLETIISIHAPRVGSDIPQLVCKASDFISIHAPRVGSDLDLSSCCSYRKDFNPRSPCGERLAAAREATRKNLFQSTLPVWGATVVSTNVQQPTGISIHAPRVGSDRLRVKPHEKILDFNPRSPCGERLWLHAQPRKQV